MIYKLQLLLIKYVSENINSSINAIRHKANTEMTVLNYLKKINNGFSLKLHVSVNIFDFSTSKKQKHYLMCI